MRVQDYALPKEIPTETKEFLDDIRRILNNGGYVPQTIPGVPSWYGEQGETVMSANGAEQRMYTFNEANGTWNFGLPLSAKYGWTYITVTNAEASHAGTLSFGYTFQSAPIVMTTFIGYQAAGVPASPADFDTGLTKICVQAYGPSTTGVNIAVYSGDGSNFPGNFNMGIAWLAIG
jgi:hypothetical protein